ncbi:MAG: exodeoxyribonuclease VII large subunit [Cellvibrionaceae bacterium]|nr:exodeoxyribonuclease VII large subunit [Cellvibrionaceae bacterium]
MQQNRQILTVSQLNRAAKDLLETYLPMLWVEGELSNLSAPSSGHWYFSLKDSGAQVRCAMFRNRNMLVRVKPEPGKKVLVRGKVSLYEGRGDYQLIVEHMELAGAGDLQRQFELLKEKLQAEGLFDPAHKKPLPAWPRRLGVVTSPTGAAVHDILHVLRRRFPALPVIVLPVAVQGNEAAGQIAAAIETANRHALCDVLIVGRGGGSLEDLWAFNEEVVARAIHASAIPVVSAVGHEVDFTIADFVADLRAPTPSAAAELISPDGPALLQQLKQYELQLSRCMAAHLRWHRQQVEHLRARLPHPKQKLQAQAQTFDHLEMRLQRAMATSLRGAQQRVERLHHKLQRFNPQHQLARHAHHLQVLTLRLEVAQRKSLEAQQQRLQRAAGLLQSVSPLNTLSRGYSILLTDTGHAVRDSAEVNEGQTLTARLHRGELICEVTAIKP